MRKKVFLSIFLLLFIGYTTGTVELGQNLSIQQDEATINTTDSFNVSNVEARDTSTTIDSSEISIDAPNNLSMTISFFQRNAPTGETVLNSTANTSSGNVNFTFTNLDNDIFRAVQNNSLELRQSRPVNGDYWFNTSNWFTGFQDLDLFNVEDTSPPQFQNVQQSRDTYLVNNPTPIDLQADVEDDNSGISQIKLATNETGNFQNRSQKYGGIKNYDAASSASVTFTWDNGFSLVQRKTVGWRIWAQDESGNWNVTNTQTFLLDEKPELVNLLVEDVRIGETSNAKAYAVDPNGRDDIVNVTFTVDAPNNRTITVEGRRGEKFNGSEYEGYAYHLNYTKTLDPGIYIVNATAHDEGNSDTATKVFNVGGLESIIKKFLINPFYLGESNLLQAISIIISKQISFIGIILVISTITAGSFIIQRSRITEEFYNRIEKVRKNEN